jgi:hypothetical protein
MLKQICEIASQNSGFIKTHFDEFVKKKAMTMLNAVKEQAATSGAAIPSK